MRKQSRDPYGEYVHDTSIHEQPPLVVYGQKLSKTRCLTAVRADTQHHRFLVGTVSLHSSNNEIHLLEYSEENDDVLCRKLFQNHVHEIWNISCCPTRSDLFFTVYNEGRAGYKATLWKMHGLEGDDDDDGAHEYDNNDGGSDRGEKTFLSQSSSVHSEQDPQNTDLESIVTLDSQDGVMHNVLWEPLIGDRVLTLENMNIREWHIDHSVSQSASAEASTYSVGGRRLHCGKWNPIDRNMVSVGAASRIVHMDLRQKRPAQIVENAHAQRVQDIDFNPWKQYFMVSGGDDGFVKFWDIRNTSAPVLALGGHSHWVCKVKYNPTHDELLLSCSTDSIINLWRVYSTSSKCKSHDDFSSTQLSPETNAAEDSNGQSSLAATVKDCLLRTIDENEESVYAVDWSRKNPWVFASVSYDGRVLIHQIPTTEKDRLLLGTEDDDEDFED